ncbi:MAG TPA: hypothetical protein VGU25_10160 [Acidobacteriaceae bacterium]|nr:hypothetical protein [Acidobacteriaceae bacterium]
MGWIAAATVAWIGVDVVSAWDAMYAAVMVRAKRMLVLQRVVNSE